MLFGLAAGAYGLRAGAAVTVRGRSVLRIERMADGLLRMTVQPTQVRSLRLGAEVRLVAELAAEVVRLAAQQHVYSFDITRADARAALSAALRGQMPDLALQAGEGAGLGVAGADGVRLLVSERLDHGEQVVSLNSLRLPELLGGSRLGGYQARSASTLTSSADGRSTTVTETSSSAGSISLLSLGSLTASSSASLVSTVGDHGAAVPQEVLLHLGSEVARGGHLLRQHMLRRLRPVLGEMGPLQPIHTTRRYAIEATQRLHIGNFAALASLSDAALHTIAETRAFPERELLAVRALTGRAIAGGLHGDYARAIAALAGRGRLGIRAVQLLAGTDSVRLDVTNSGHDQMLIDFLKAETYALGARTHAHARAVMARLERLSRRIAQAQHDLAGDQVQALMGADELAKRARFFAVLDHEVSHLAADISEDLYR